MRAVRLFLRARAVINFLMRAASTLEIANGEQRALRKFPASWNLSLLKHCFAPSNLADTFKQDNRLKAMQHNKALPRSAVSHGGRTCFLELRHFILSGSPSLSQFIFRGQNLR